MCFLQSNSTTVNSERMIEFVNAFCDDSGWTGEISYQLDPQLGQGVVNILKVRLLVLVHLKSQCSLFRSPVSSYPSFASSVADSGLRLSRCRIASHCALLTWHFATRTNHPTTADAIRNRARELPPARLPRHCADHCQLDLAVVRKLLRHQTHSQSTCCLVSSGFEPDLMRAFLFCCLYCCC